MSEGTADLVQLIDLSLGGQPSGVVNFNYLHALMHAIVGRLGSMEHAFLAGALAEGLPFEPGVAAAVGIEVTTTVGGKGVPSTPGREAGKEVLADKRPTSTKQETAAAPVAPKKPSVEPQQPPQQAPQQPSQQAPQQAPQQPSQQALQQLPQQAPQQPSQQLPQQPSPQALQQPPQQLSQQALQQAPQQPSQPTFQQPSQQAFQQPSQQAFQQPSQQALQEQSQQSLQPSQQALQQLSQQSRSEAGEVTSSEQRIPSSGRTSRTAGPAPSAHFYHRQKSSIVTAANDLGALERKLQDLEMRMNSMDTLPELLERKSSNMGATPIKDRWNFTNLNKRLSAAEDGLEQNSTLVDDLLGEVQNIKSTVAGFETSVSDLQDKLSSEISAIYEQLKGLDDLKMAAAKDSMGEAATAMLRELQEKIDALQSELDTLKGAVTSIDLSPFATREELEVGLQEQNQMAQQSSDTLTGKMESMEADLTKLSEQIEELQTTKLNIADMASLMPKGDSEEMAALLPRLMELQNRVDQIEGEVGKQVIPPDLLDQISAMQKAIDKLTADLATLSSQMGSSSEEKARLEELGSEVAQLRERMSEVDRAVGALSDAVSAIRDAAAPADEETDVKWADADSLTALQEMVNQQQQDQERLIGTAADLSNEMEINKEHIKTLYNSVNDLGEMKADKEQIEVEVREKADRTLLEGKASREWVNSTFEELDKKIREARDQLLGQEEALRSAVHRLDEDVDTKLDKGELGPLKDYFDKKLARVKTAPPEREEPLAEDAAGFRKPLRYRCISCDRPLGLKTSEAIPALPSIGTMPGNRSFRPYTTYELELIRRHQKMGLPVFGPMMRFSRGPRSAGGAHTLTNSRRRVRIAPLSSAYSPEPYSSPSRVSVHQEVDIMGQDGHMYKGRSSSRNKLPPIKNRTSTSYH